MNQQKKRLKSILMVGLCTLAGFLLTGYLYQKKAEPANSSTPVIEIYSIQGTQDRTLLTTFSSKEDVSAGADIINEYEPIEEPLEASECDYVFMFTTPSQSGTVAEYRIWIEGDKVKFTGPYIVRGANSDYKETPVAGLSKVSAEELDRLLP